MSTAAKVLTTADADELVRRYYAAYNPRYTAEEWARLRATTRALETAQTALTIAASRANDEAERAEKAERARDEALLAIDCGQDVVCATPPGCLVHWEERCRELVRERDSAVSEFGDERQRKRRELEEMDARLENAERSRDEEDARSDRLQRELDDALHTFRCVEETEQFRAMEARAEKAEKQRDAARDNYENMRQHSVALHALADEAVGEGDTTRALVAELVTALAGLERKFLDPAPNEPGGPCWCDPVRYTSLFGHEDSCDAARSALAKAKGAKP
jgi:hypothetical protein